MADRSIAQAVWTRHAGKELGLFLCMLRDWSEKKDRHVRQRTQVEIWGDTATARISSITVAGAVYGTNCTVDGYIYVRITANGGNWDVDFYRATGAGGGDKVAHVTNVAASSTTALTADNDSGITGSITLTGSISAEATDRLKLRVIIDYPARVAQVFNQDGSSEDDAFGSDVANDLDEVLAGLAEQGIQAIRAAIARFQCGDENHAGRANKLFEAADTVSYQEAFRSVDGLVTVTRSGAIETMRTSMRDDTDGGEQSVLERVVADGAASFGSNNRGVGAVSAFTPGERLPAGRLVMKCTAGADTNNIDAQRFDGYYAKDEGSDETRIPCGGLIVGRPWTGPGGISFTLTNTISKANDGSNTKLAAASAFSFTGMKNANSDYGTIYVLIKSNGSAWDVFFYSSEEARDAAQGSATDTGLVAMAQGIATGGAFLAAAAGGSGLQVSGQVGSGPSNNDECELALNPFYRQNASLEADTFEIPFTVAAGAGLYQSTLARHGLGELNSASSNPTIPDTYVKAGTFAPVAVTDN